MRLVYLWGAAVTLFNTLETGVCLLQFTVREPTAFFKEPPKIIHVGRLYLEYEFIYLPCIHPSSGRVYFMYLFAASFFRPCVLYLFILGDKVIFEVSFIHQPSAAAAAFFRTFIMNQFLNQMQKTQIPEEFSESTLLLSQQVCAFHHLPVWQ